MVLPLINSLALFASGYLLGSRPEKEAPSSNNYQAPYQPPFLGGQCPVQYTVTLQTRRTLPNGSTFDSNQGTWRGMGAIRFLGLYREGNTLYSSVQFATSRVDIPIADLRSDPSLESQFKDTSTLSRSDGLPDNCGNLPNPNPIANTNESGLASGGGDPAAVPVTELAAPIVPFLPSFLSALRAALAAAAAAANALDGIKALAEAIGAIIDLLKKIRDELNEREKEKDKNKEVLSYRFGTIEKDGFLRFYPNDSFADCEAFQLDILIESVPVGYGKYFGRYSPNYFEYKRLGHIAFVSGSFGIIERKYIEFGRSSFSVPKGSIGFFYHLGLDGTIKADSSAIYLREVQQIE